MKEKLPISAVVVTCNEAHLLDDCLKSLQFCDELILLNMESTDNSEEIGKMHHFNVVPIPKVPVVEEARLNISQKTRHDWILFLDPDERIMPELKQQLIHEFPSLKKETEISGIQLPWRFYYKGKKLKGTTWGGVQYKTFLVNRDKVHFNKNVHRDLQPKKTFVHTRIAPTEKNYVQHLWMNSFRQLLSKHKRYLKKEGESMYNNGLRYSFKQHLTAGPYSFWRSFIKRKGFKDGFKGFILSVFWGWYNVKKWSGLKKHEKLNSSVNH